WLDSRNAVQAAEARDEVGAIGARNQRPLTSLAEALDLPRKMHTPGLLRRRREAEHAIRDPHLDDPSLVRDADRGIPDGIPRGVAAAGRPILLADVLCPERIVLHAGRVDRELKRRLAVALRIDGDGEPVGLHVLIP